jgi:excisionase family DNA binding protein
MAVSKLRQEGKVSRVDGLFVQSLLLSIPEVARLLRLSRTKVYELIAVEGLPVVRFGRAVRVSRASLEQWIQERERGA